MKNAHKWRQRSHAARLGILIISIVLFLAAWGAFAVSWLSDSHAAITTSLFAIGLFGTKGLFWGVFIYSGWRLVEWCGARHDKADKE